MYLLFDIGGTKTRIALSHDKTSFSDPVVLETSQDFATGIEAIAEIARELSEGEVIEAAGGGVAGPLNKAKTELINSPHLPDWIRKPLAKELGAALKSPVYLENDTAIVGLGEAVAGAGKGHDIVVYMTVSTGVGGARIVGQKIDQSVFGFEPGHQIIDFDGTACPQCVSHGAKESGVGVGHLEAYVSGTATEGRFGVPPNEITDPATWDTIAKWLAVGLNNTIVHWSPDVVVLGGSMVVKKPGIYIEDVRKHLTETLTIFPEHPTLKEAQLADIGGLHGALAYIQACTQEGR